MDPPELVESARGPCASPRQRGVSKVWDSAALAELPSGPVGYGMSSPRPMQPAMSGESSRCSSATSVRFGSYATGAEAAGNRARAPVLLCGCRRPVDKHMSHTEWNPEREFYICANRGKTAGTKYCYTWIWVDLVQKYVSELLEYSTGPLRQQIDEMQLKNDAMRGQIQKFKMLRYALLAGVMLGLVLPAGSVAAFLLVGVITLMMFLV